MEGGRRGPVRGWGGLDPGTHDHEAGGSCGVVRPHSLETVLRVLTEVSESSDDDFSYVDNDEELVKLVEAKSIRDFDRKKKDLAEREAALARDRRALEQARSSSIEAAEDALRGQKQAYEEAVRRWRASQE